MLLMSALSWSTTSLTSSGRHVNRSSTNRSPLPPSLLILFQGVLHLSMKALALLTGG
jgi:hypothetical protein